MGTFIDGVGTFNMTGGSVNGTGTLSAVGGLNLQAGTINANIGNSSVAISNGTTTINGTVGGAVTVSSGTANLGGALNSSLTASGGTANLSNTVAGNVTVSGGTMNLGAADLISNASTVNVSSGSLNMNGNDSVGAVTVSGGTVGGSGVLTGTSYAVQAGTISAGIGGSGAMTKTGAGTATLSANNAGYSGAVTVSAGTLLATTSGALGTGAVTVTNGGTIAANGVTLANNFTIGAPAGSQVYYTENFNSVGGGLPTGWTVRTGASASALGTTSTLNTNATDWSSATGQFANYAATTGLTAAATSGQQSGSTNRALGVRTTGSFGDPGASFVYSFNTTGQTVDSISLDLMQLATNARSVTWSIEYGLGASPSSFTLLGTWADPGAWGSTSTNFTSALFSTNLNNQSNLVFRVTALSGSTGSGTRDTSAIDNFTINTIGAATGSGILGIEQAGSATFSGNVLNNNGAVFTAASGGLATFSGTVSGNGSVSKTGTGTVTLSGNNSYSGGTTLTTGVLRLESATGAGTGTITQSDGTSTIEIDTTGTVANAMNFHNLSTLQTVTLSGNKTLNNSTYTVAASTTTTESGVLSGVAVITKEGTGSLVVTASNSFTGATVVNAGTLNLNSSTGSALGASTSVTVSATLLISQSGQVADNAAITLSGGTISRASGVSETFGALSLTDESFLDFGSGTSGNLTFGAYEDNGAPSALLTVNNFFGGNTLVFGSNLSSYIDASYNGTAFTSEFFNINSTSGGFTSNWNGSTFTITAIPEPSTYLAAAGLLSLMLWPSRKRIIKDAKKILGLRAPMRDRLAAKRA
jgi:autotransporter-associated beta strand protein